MRLYEAMVIVDDSRCAEDYNAVAEHVQGILRKSGAEIKRFVRWDERKLAYLVDRHSRGVYVLTHFMAPPENIAQITRDWRLSDMIVRAMITVPHKSDAAEILAGPAEEAPAAEPQAAETAGPETAEAPDTAEAPADAPAEDTAEAPADEQTEPQAEGEDGPAEQPDPASEDAEEQEKPQE